MDIDERCDYDGGFHLRPGEDIGHEFRKLGVTVDVFGIWVVGTRDTTKCKVYRLHGALDDIV